MKNIIPKSNWPESWKLSYAYDLEEIYGKPSNLGYVYAYKNRQRHTFNLIQEVLAPHATILDVAGAQGNFSLLLAELGYQVTWNDLRSDLIEYVKMKHESGSIIFAPGNAFELKFPTLFDAVLITEVIEHTAHPDDFLKKISTLVKPGGYIIMTTPNGAYFRNDLPMFSDCADPSKYEDAEFGPNSENHIFLLHTKEIQLFAKNIGLQIEKTLLFTNPLTNGHIKLEWLLKLLPKSFVNRLELFSQRIPASIASRIFTHTAVRFRVPQLND
ncbi:MAG: methyltransferase domain-containing protein [Cytophaga sp.]|nr:methyltransferase domain-containing protein [Undibacterium sp.]